MGEEMASEAVWGGAMGRRCWVGDVGREAMGDDGVEGEGMGATGMDGGATWLPPGGHSIATISTPSADSRYPAHAQACRNNPAPPIPRHPATHRTSLHADLHR